VGLGEGSKQMKTTIKKTVEEVVEIQLPYFFKTVAHNVAIISETEALQVTDLVGGFEILQINSAESALKRFSGIEKMESTREEFLDAYGMAMDSINTKAIKI